MEYSNLVKDFAQRTRQNLELLKTLQRQHPDLEIYEVTQLINSMLGLLVFPQQRYVRNIPRVPLDELARQGWPIPRVKGDYPQVSDLNQLVRYLRNAVAHFNIEFISDNGRQIQGIVVWNKNPREGGIDWKAELTLSEIETITDKFIDLLTKD